MQIRNRQDTKRRSARQKRAVPEWITTSSRQTPRPRSVVRELPKLTLWRITDGRRGHENQTAGIAMALSSQTQCETIDIPIDSIRGSWWNVLSGRFPEISKLPKPNLILGAGRRTHKKLLAASRATGAPSVVLMTPARFLIKYFDLCIVPEHDNVTAQNIVTTKGAPNLIRPATNASPDHGLLLIGGPSKHHKWNEAQLSHQLDTIVASNPEIHWTLTKSPRTPQSTVRLLSQKRISQLDIVPVETTTSDWLPKQLNTSSNVWVTEDSVSMVYEALSSGARVGLLTVPRSTSKSRVIRGIDQLLADKYVHAYHPRQTILDHVQQAQTLNEAERIGSLIIRRFFS